MKIQPTIQWKRKKMDDNVNAYKQVLDGCGKHNPWLSVPADHKWYRNYLVATRIVETFEKLKMKFTR
jgi:polyphosphate kinase 2 (PPK2 family)